MEFNFFPPNLDYNNYCSREFTTIFLVLAAVSIAVPFIPLLQDLLCHGKRQKVKEVSDDQGSATLKMIPVKAVLLAVPKSFFTHMYIVGSIVGGYCCFYACSLFASSPTILAGSVAVQGTIMFEIHCLRRLFECIYITEYGTSSMDVSAYVVGIYHYLVTPTCIMCSLLHTDTKMSGGEDQPYQIYVRLLSFSLYCIGNISQNQCHRILYQLKKRKQASAIGTVLNRDNNDINGGNSSNSSGQINNLQKSLNSNGYSFPTGFGFNYVACPHYTAEILIYTSFNLLSPSSLPLYSMTVWVISNLCVVADTQFEWYKKYFPEETKKRKNWKRIFPTIW